MGFWHSMSCMPWTMRLWCWCFWRSSWRSGKRTGQRRPIALAFGLVGAAAFFSSNPAASMLTLSDQYAAAGGEAQRAMYLAAGQAVLALFTSSAYHASYILGSIAGLTMSVVMLRSPAFGRTAGYAGIAANVLGFGLYVPVIGVWLSLLSVIPFLMIWYVLVARRLLRLARSEGA